MSSPVAFGPRLGRGIAIEALDGADKVGKREECEWGRTAAKAKERGLDGEDQDDGRNSTEINRF